MQLALGYNRRLRAYDRALRVRWSPVTERWLLERQARYERNAVDPDVYGDKEHDTYRQLADGYFTLGIYQPHDLPTVDTLIAYLKTQDTWVTGKTAEAVADELDADYFARREARRQQANREAGDVAGEVYENHQWSEGHRVTVPATFPSS